MPVKRLFARRAQLDLPPAHAKLAAVIQSSNPGEQAPDQPLPVSRRKGRPPLDASKRRQRILDAAWALFLKHGFAETTVDAVSALAGVTKRTIYEVVGDKEALFRAVCGQNTSSAANLQFPELTAQTTVAEALSGLARALLAHAIASTQTAIARMLIIESTRFPDLSRQILEGGTATIHNKIMAVFRHLEDLGLARIPDITLATQIFYDVIVGNLAFRVTLGLGNGQMDDSELERRLETFIRGYLADIADTATSET